MKPAYQFVLATVLMAASSVAPAEACKTVNGVVKAAAAGVATQVAMAAAPVAAVTHSSGALILTGGSGYLANTLGAAAGAWAVATAPVTIAVTAGALVTGAGIVAACHFISPD